MEPWPSVEKCNPTIQQVSSGRTYLTSLCSCPLFYQSLPSAELNEKPDWIREKKKRLASIVVYVCAYTYKIKIKRGSDECFNQENKVTCYNLMWVWKINIK